MLGTCSKTVHHVHAYNCTNGHLSATAMLDVNEPCNLARTYCNIHTCMMQQLINDYKYTIAHEGIANGSQYK